MQYQRGSIWRKWDLHFHTPSSYDYKDKTISNQEIINILVQNNIEVVAITDHHFIDIERIRELQRLGADKVTIFPAIEFLSDAKGQDPIHFIGIFSEDCNIEHIWGQIQHRTNISKISGESKKHNEVYCDLLDTAKLVKELGGILTIHAGSKTNSIENITHSLPHGTAQKEDIAEAIDIFELGKECDFVDYNKFVIPYLQKKISKTHPLIICSDNHNIKNYTLKQNLWIKADANFSGLKQVLNQPDRVFIGSKPPSIELFEQNPTKFIDKIAVYKKPNSTLDEIWFNNIDISLNTGLVAIVGNKGNGKSAVTDLLGLCGNTYNNDGFSFLHKDKFLSENKRKASQFEAQIFWKDGTNRICNFIDSVDRNKVERVKYIPQSYLEKLCVSIESEAFEDELKNIIYSHIPYIDRLGKNSLEELISHKTSVVRDKIENIKSKLSTCNSKIIELEEKEAPVFILSLRESLNNKEEELQAHRNLKPIQVDKLSTEASGETETISQEILELTDEKLTIETTLQENQKKIGELNKDIEILQQRVRALGNLSLSLSEDKTLNKNILKNYGLNIDNILSYNIDTTSIAKLIEVKKNDIEVIKSSITSEINGEKRRISIINKIELLKAKLDEPTKIYQQYVIELSKWEKREKEIIGDTLTFDSIIKIKSEIEYIENELSKELDKEKLERNTLIKGIFSEKIEIMNICKDLYNSVTQFIQDNKDLLGDYDVSFDISFNENGLFSKFSNIINFNSKGTFYGDSNGDKIKQIFELYTFNNADSALNFILDVIESMKTDLRTTTNDYREIQNQLKLGHKTLDFYNFISSLDYIDSNYDLKLNNKKTKALSPGERGALLLIFYLILDNNNIPLIIDQPEENLDNQSIYNILVPFIKRAKNRRQIVIVTHNPNLAVVCDAEQIIYVRIDKENKNQVYIETGSIENTSINRKLVEILEGTMPAFKTRTVTYLIGK